MVEFDYISFVINITLLAIILRILKSYFKRK